MRWAPVALAAAAVAPVVAGTPRPRPVHPEGVRSLADAVAVCRDIGLRDWDLVRYAQELVHRKFTRYSILSLWEPPALAFRNSRGYCNQYNGALWHILRELGFDAQRVFATRVRQDSNPWWRMGHSWVQVTIDGRTLDVCAGMPDNRPGNVSFIPVTEVLPFGTFTYWNTNNGMIVFTIGTVWRSLLSRRELPRWVEREFGTRVHQPGPDAAGETV
ncbi:arylamine N-acetyltransferase [Granulicoccus sp. GXG6511]|uniref:arylamine N-acetyltransferase n=1 Tax=Granulicoccus sp. GXG6511 TaxID=3381351 RepID=UPI003D7EC3B5